MITLKRDIGLLGAGLLVLNGLIGAGIFALPEKLYLSLGPFSPWVFPLFAGLMLTIAWCFAELTRLYPSTGGPVVYTTQAFGPFVGFQTGWLFFLARATALAANVHVLLLYASYLWPSLQHGWTNTLALILILAGLTLGNLLGVKRAMQLLDGMTIVKITPVFAIAALALWAAPELGVPSDLPSIDSLEAGALLTLYALIGFENVVVTGGETKQPQKTLPKALMVTLLGTALLYFVVQLAYVGWRQDQSVEGPPLVALGESLLGYWGGVAIMLAAVFSIGANLLANMVSTARIPLAMAETGQLPPLFGHIHDRYATPDIGILALGSLAIALALSGSFTWLAVVSVLSRLVMYLSCVAALWATLRKRRQQGQWPLKVAMLVGFGVCVWAIAQSTREAWFMLLGQFAVGIGFYLLCQRSLQKANTLGV